MKNIKIRSITAFCTIFILIFLITNSSIAEVGVSKDIVKVGHIGALSGPAAYLGTQALRGIETYITYMNDQGGVHGRKIKLVIGDSGYVPPRAVSVVKRLISRDRVFCFLATVGSPVCLAITKIIEDKKIPHIAPGSPSSLMFESPYKRYHFQYLFVTYDVQARIMVEYIVKHLQVKNARIGIIYQDDEFGRNTLKGLYQGLDHYGLKIFRPVQLAKFTACRLLVSFASYELQASIIMYV